MKRIRLLIYEGSPNWMDQTLAYTLVVGRHTFGSDRSIRVVEDLSEITDIIERMNQQKELNNSIPPEETI